MSKIKSQKHILKLKDYPLYVNNIYPTFAKATGFMEGHAVTSTTLSS
jgi:hypothetical protein